jgi:proliferating cell nuclear antigen
MVDRIFEIKTLKSVIIKSVFEIIKPYIKETNILIGEDGFKIATMDTSKSTLTYIKLDSAKFESYYCKQPTIIGIDTTTLFKTIKSANRKDTITFYMDSTDQDKLGIELADTFVGKIKDYKIPLLTLDEKVIQIPPMQYDSIINIPSSLFQQIIKDIHLVDGKVIEIKSIGKQLIFSSEGGLADFTTSISELDNNINKDHLELLKQNGEDTRCVKFTQSTTNIIQGKYKLIYLMNFIKASHLCDNMNILISNDKPLILEYFVADIGVMRLLITPIVN